MKTELYLKSDYINTTIDDGVWCYDVKKHEVVLVDYDRNFVSGEPTNPNIILFPFENDLVGVAEVARMLETEYGVDLGIYRRGVVQRIHDLGFYENFSALRSDLLENRFRKWWEENIPA